MLAGAIVVDLITLVAQMQRTPIPTVVMIDEFAALAAGQVNRLFGRARSSGISLILGTQELADLGATGQDGLREQVLANIETLIAHRQNVPESAELIAQIAGTKPVWVSTEQTEEGLLLSGAKRPRFAPPRPRVPNPPLPHQVPRDRAGCRHYPRGGAGGCRRARQPLGAGAVRRPPAGLRPASGHPSLHRVGPLTT